MQCWSLTISEPNRTKMKKWNNSNLKMLCRTHSFFNGLGNMKQLLQVIMINTAQYPNLHKWTEQNSWGWGDHVMEVKKTTKQTETPGEASYQNVLGQGLKQRLFRAHFYSRALAGRCSGWRRERWDIQTMRNNNSLPSNHPRRVNKS